MALTRAQQTILEKARTLGAGAQGVALADDQCKGLIGVIVHDLGISEDFPEVGPLPTYFDAIPVEALAITSGSLMAMFERLVALVTDGETYFASLAALHKARLKYRRILATQPVPTIEQVGPRGLLEYGALPADGLVALLLWRKWMYDIDNRAAQETGYLFEPILAAAIGGTPAPARSSPVKRRSDRSKGRQVDCVTGRSAYEFKLRVTIAASGQGRWREELDFPADCHESGYRPHLVVFDSTPNPKLAELVQEFRDWGGEAHVGTAAWEHLESLAGETMAVFIERYLRRPLDDLLGYLLEGLPQLTLTMEPDRILFAFAENEYDVPRDTADESLITGGDDIPEDATDRLPGL